MATIATAYGDLVNSVYRAYTEGSYTITDTQYVFSITGGLNIPTSGYKTTRAFTSTVYVGSTPLGSATINTGTRTGVLKTAIKTASYTVTRTHNNQTITFKSILKGSSENTTSTATCTSVTVPAKSSWTVLYDANGGSGAPGNQTKWYGETLTLSSTVPVKTNHTFLGWATSSTNANNGIVAYQKGASYTTNSGATLWAVWKQNYSLPTITNLSAVRCNDATGTVTDASETTGQYIKLSFSYTGGSLDGGNNYETPTCIVTIDNQQVDAPTITSGGPDSITMVYGNNYNGGQTYIVDNSHTISVKLFDNNNTTGTTKTITVGAAIFPIDILANGSAMGLMSPASEESGHKVTIGGNTYINGDTYVSNDAYISGNLTINNSQLSDFVIERSSATSTDGGWYYRKWKSGRVEAWGYITKASTAGTIWASPIYYTDVSVAIPSGIFTTDPIRGYVTSSSVQWIPAGIGSMSTTQVGFRLMKPSSGSQSISCYIYLCSF